MSTDRSPSGTHPGDATLLFLGDVVHEADAAALIDELAGDPETANDATFGPTAISAAWTHVTTCDSCSARRIALLARIDILLTELPDRSEPQTDSADLDRRVTNAVRELVPSPGAVPPVMSSATSHRRGFLAGLRRGKAGGGASGAGGGGVLAGRRTWVVGAALALSVVAATIVLRPQTSQTDAIAPATTKLTTRTTTAFTSDTTAAAADAAAAAAETQAATLEEATTSPSSASADTVARRTPGAAAKADAEVLDEAPPPSAGNAMAAPAPSPVAPSPPPLAAPLTTPPSSATLNRSKKVVAPNEPVPTAAPVAAGGASVAPAVPRPAAGTDVDLGAFTVATDVLDRFAAVLSPKSSATTIDAALAPAAAAPQASGAPLPCPQPLPGGRATATVGGIAVVVVRLVDPTGANDVVLNASTCVEIARRPSPT